ncbi:MAG: hypothetical protein HW421_2102 [Ignavibacteria bacterium]|nr:hypothetical protein [Ignavibacteria bacterium]
MSSVNISQEKAYYDLTEHNFTQVIVFLLLLIGGFLLLFMIGLPWLEGFVKDYFNGVVYNSGEKVGTRINSNELIKTTHYYYNWAVDVYAKSPEQLRYWFNPILSLFMPALLTGMMISFGLSALLPRSIGFIRQKIEREISSTLYKISQHISSIREISETEISEEIIQADLQELNNLARSWNISLEEIKTLQRALKWQSYSPIMKFFGVNSGLMIYMRSYFTVVYGNTILGLVYIGAAVLIIIIGLRGLKFIPPTQPSLVLFALGLEFTLLLVYAFTLMYSKQEEETELLPSKQTESYSLSSEFDNTKELESLLRVFVKRKKKNF